MKKYGKYEMRPVSTAEKKSEKKLNDMLLRTYLTSLLCLVLCVTMFFGTSYAWFTSEVTSSDNEIYIGTLDVNLLNNERKNFSANEKLFDSDVRWEPGYTMLETVTVENNGDLAFNYELRFTDGTLADQSELKLNEVAECFDVWVYSHHKHQQKPAVSNYSQDIVDNEKWVYAGTLDELLAGKVVFSGSMDDVRYEPQIADPEDPDATAATAAANPGTTDGKATSHTYYLALHMKENTTADKVMGQKLTLNVKLIAYQMTSEKDSIQATEGYDRIVTAANLKELLAASGNVVLTSDIAVRADDEVAEVKIAEGVILDGNGRTVSFGEGVENGAVTLACGQVDNLTVKGQVNAAADVVLTNCNFEKLVLAEGAETVTLINCKVGNNTVEKAVLTVSKGENGERIWSSDHKLVSVTNGSVTVAKATE